MSPTSGLGVGPLGSMPLGGFVTGLTFIIGGEDRSSKISKRGLRITDVLTSQVDFATFQMDDMAESEIPQEGQEVIISSGEDRKFGGIIATVERMESPTQDFFKIRVKDFSKLLEKRLVTRVFDMPTSAGNVIKAILDDFVQDARIGQELIEDGPTIDRISFNFKPALQAIKEIARLTSHEWFIDGFKRLHFFPKSTSAPPFGIQPGEIRYQKFRLRPDTSQLRNRIIVKGGVQESDTFPEEYLGDGTQRTFRVSHKAIGTPVVKVNGVVKTVAIKNSEDEGTKDFLFDPNDLVVENDQHATLTGSDTLRLEYKFEIPILVQVEDPASISDIAATEGSDGIYEYIIQDNEIGSLEAARDRGRAELSRFGRAIFKGKFVTWVDGFRSGQLLPVQFPDKNIDLQLLITKVTFASIGLGRGFYSVEFGSFSNDFKDFLLSLFNSTRKIEVRTGEVLDDLLSASEAVAIADVAITFEQKTPPFTYGPGGANDFVWGEGSWG